MTDPIARMRTGPAASGKKGGGGLGVGLATALVVGAGAGYYRYSEKQDEKDGKRGAIVSACFERLVERRGFEESAYREAARKFRKHGDTYVNCVALETCSRTPQEPVSYFFELLKGRNACLRDEYRYRARNKTGLPARDEPAPSVDPALLGDFYPCFAELSEREREVLLVSVGKGDDVSYARKWDVKLATVRQDRGRAARKLKKCMDADD